MADKPEEAFSAREQFEDEYYTLVARARQLLSNSGAASERFLECGGGVAGSTDSIPGSLVRVVSHDGQQLHARILLDNEDQVAQFYSITYRRRLSTHP
ncbi:unnamed protein product, partial [Iphiclides podalirius]